MDTTTSTVSLDKTAPNSSARVMENVWIQPGEMIKRKSTVFCDKYQGTRSTQTYKFGGLGWKRFGKSQSKVEYLREKKKLEEMERKMEEETKKKLKKTKAKKKKKKKEKKPRVSEQPAREKDKREEKKEGIAPFPKPAREEDKREEKKEGIAPFPKPMEPIREEGEREEKKEGEAPSPKLSKEILREGSWAEPGESDECVLEPIPISWSDMYVPELMVKYPWWTYMSKWVKYKLKTLPQRRRKEPEDDDISNPETVYITSPDIYAEHATHVVSTSGWKSRSTDKKSKKNVTAKSPKGSLAMSDATDISDPETLLISQTDADLADFLQAQDSGQKSSVPLGEVKEKIIKLRKRSKRNIDESPASSVASDRSEPETIYITSSDIHVAHATREPWDPWWKPLNADKKRKSSKRDIDQSPASSDATDSEPETIYITNLDVDVAQATREPWGSWWKPWSAGEKSKKKVKAKLPDENLAKSDATDKSDPDTIFITKKDADLANRSAAQDSGWKFPFFSWEMKSLSSPKTPDDRRLESNVRNKGIPKFIIAEPGNGVTDERQRASTSGGRSWIEPVQDKRYQERQGKERSSKQDQDEVYADIKEHSSYITNGKERKEEDKNKDNKDESPKKPLQMPMLSYLGNFLSFKEQTLRMPFASKQSGPGEAADEANRVGPDKNRDDSPEKDYFKDVENYQERHGKEIPSLQDQDQDQEDSSNKTKKKKRNKKGKEKDDKYETQNLAHRPGPYENRDDPAKEKEGKRYQKLQGIEIPSLQDQNALDADPEKQSSKKKKIKESKKAQRPGSKKNKGTSSHDNSSIDVESYIELRVLNVSPPQDLDEEDEDQQREFSSYKKKSTGITKDKKKTGIKAHGPELDKARDVAAESDGFFSMLGKYIQKRKFDKDDDFRAQKSNYTKPQDFNTVQDQDSEDTLKVSDTFSKEFDAEQDQGDKDEVITKRPQADKRSQYGLGSIYRFFTTSKEESASYQKKGREKKERRIHHEEDDSLEQKTEISSEVFDAEQAQRSIKKRPKADSRRQDRLKEWQVEVEAPKEEHVSRKKRKSSTKEGKSQQEEGDSPEEENYSSRQNQTASGFLRWFATEVSGDSANMRAVDTKMKSSDRGWSNPFGKAIFGIGRAFQSLREIFLAPFYSVEPVTSSENLDTTKDEATEDESKEPQVLERKQQHEDGACRGVRRKPPIFFPAPYCGSVEDERLQHAQSLAKKCSDSFKEPQLLERKQQHEDGACRGVRRKPPIFFPAPYCGNVEDERLQHAQSLAKKCSDSFKEPQLLEGKQQHEDGACRVVRRKPPIFFPAPYCGNVEDERLQHAQSLTKKCSDSFKELEN